MPQTGTILHSYKQVRAGIGSQHLIHSPVSSVLREVDLISPSPSHTHKWRVHPAIYRNRVARIEVR